MSINDPYACGFVKVAAYHILNNQNIDLPLIEGEKAQAYKSRELTKKFDLFKKQFSCDSNFSVSYHQFTTKFSKLKKDFQWVGKKSKELRANLLSTFSIEVWDNLSFEKKSKHSVYDCKACIESKKLSDVLLCLPGRGKVNSNIKKEMIDKKKLQEEASKKKVEKRRQKRKFATVMKENVEENLRKKCVET